MAERRSKLLSQVADEDQAVTARFKRAEQIMSSNHPDDLDKPNQLNEPDEYDEPIKLVKYSFSAPEDEVAGIDRVIQRCLKNGVAMTRAMVFRVALANLDKNVSVDDMVAIRNTLPELKPGPKPRRRR